MQCCRERPGNPAAPAASGRNTMKKKNTARPLYRVLQGVICALWLLIGCSRAAVAQRENVWAFGTDAGLDFNGGGTPVPIQTGMQGFGEACASVCDPSGQLQFYTNGTDVWSRNHQRMPNGHNLTGLVPPAMDTGIITSSTSQGALIIPVPDNAGKYYIFSLTALEMGGLRGRLYYSVVDMSLNNGWGDIVPGQKGTLVDSGLTEKMTAVAGNRCNIWLVTSVLGEAKYKVYEITTAGVQTTPVISNGGMTDLGVGNLALSPDRKWIAASGIPIFAGNLVFGLHLAAFDVNTGMISGNTVLDPGKNGYGTCFSPDNSKLYFLCSDNRIYQFDLSLGATAAIIASEVSVGNAGMLTHLKRAPDGKIYFANSTSQLGMIHNPGLAGTACGFTLNAIALLPGTSAALGLPNVVAELDVDSFVLAPKEIKGACFSTSVALSADNTTTAWDYHWSTGAAAAQIEVSVPGTYWVSYRTGDPCRYYTDTFNVTFPYGILPLLGISNSCSDTSNGMACMSIIAGDTTTYSFTWSNGATTVLATGDTLRGIPPGNYSVHLVTGSGCDTTIKFYLPGETYQVSFSVDSISCLGDILTFQNHSDNHFTTWRWRFGDGQLSDLASPAYRYAVPGRYEVTLTGRGSICSDTASHWITVDAPVTEIRLDMDQRSICSGDAILFAPGTDSTTTGLDWRFGEDHLDHNPLAPVRKAFDLPGIYPVKLTAHFRACPEISTSDSVIVHALPRVDLGPDSVLCLGGRAISLVNHALNEPGNYRQVWSTGEQAAQIDVRHPGRYQLTLTNDFGCTVSESVEIKKDCYIDIPNAFTPNGDGVNDYFFPRQLMAAKLTGFRMSIYNRWGQLIFETSNTNGRGWDGRFNGKEQPAGVYIYRVAVVLDNRRQEQYEGNVTLIR